MVRAISDVSAQFRSLAVALTVICKGDVPAFFVLPHAIEVGAGLRPDWRIPQTIVTIDFTPNYLVTLLP